jgi:hypothetical protein
LDAASLREETWVEWLLYWLWIPWTWLRLTVHNSHGILRVWDIIHFRPMRAGLIGLDHPWCTGLNPETGRVIWPQNVLYRSHRWLAAHKDWTYGETPDDDEAIVIKTGRFLASMVARSAATPEVPWGRKRRMPHGINYIHGAVNYNAGFLLFDDFRDGIEHFSDPKFVAEVRRFARRERREVVAIFRDRDYDLVDYAYFIAFLRTMVPWFCNCNGPKQRVLWGNPAPYPTVNLITGNWIRDTYRIKTEAGRREVVRPSIAPGVYFQNGPYRGVRRRVRWPEKMLAVLTYYRIRARGARGGLFFVDRRKLLAETLAFRRAANIADQPVATLEFYDRRRSRRTAIEPHVTRPKNTKAALVGSGTTARTSSNEPNSGG